MYIYVLFGNAHHNFVHVRQHYPAPEGATCRTSCNAQSCSILEATCEEVQNAVFSILLPRLPTVPLLHVAFLYKLAHYLDSPMM